jgi:hypothetical protein
MSSIEKEQIIIKRKEYLDQQITHAEYYEWIGNTIHFNQSMLKIPLNEIRKSTDPHFNDIELHRWDEPHDNIRYLIGLYIGSIGWSLSDTVCLVKIMAQKWCK